MKCFMDGLSKCEVDILDGMVKGVERYMLGVGVQEGVRNLITGAMDLCIGCVIAGKGKMLSAYLIKFALQVNLELLNDIVLKDIVKDLDNILKDFDGTKE